MPRTPLPVEVVRSLTRPNHVRLQGCVVEIVDDPELADIDRWRGWGRLRDAT